MIKRIPIKDWIYSHVGRVLPTELSKNLLFVVGTGRCGTTLLMRILNTNDSVHILEGELNTLFHRGLYPYRASLGSRVPSMKEDPERFTKASLQNWDRNARLLKSRLKTESLLTDRDTLVVKSAMVSMMIDEIHELFPQAHFIHLYRHAIPVINSWIVKDFKKRDLPFTSEAEMGLAAAHYWANSIDAILASDRQGKRIHHVSYEDLVANPRAVLKGISDAVSIGGRYDYPFEQVEDRNRGYRLMKGLPGEEIRRVINPVLPKLGYDKVDEIVYMDA